MPPKKEEKKQIVRAFEPSPFWSYAHPEQETLGKVQTFLTTFDKELRQLILQSQSIEENFEILCEKMGYTPHPSLQNQKKQPSQYPQLRNNDYGEKFIVLLNHKVDKITLKLLTFLLSSYKVNSLKISHNDLDYEADQVKQLLQKEGNLFSQLLDSATTLFFEWNPLLNAPNRKELFLSTVKPTLQHLILREDNLGNQICEAMIKKIKNFTDMHLKSLDLSGNELTSDIGDIICQFVEEQKSLQFFGISKNKLNSSDFLQKLFNSIGEVPLSEEEYAEHQEKVKERDEVIERNKKKKKGAADQPIPFVLDVKETENGRFFIKNMSIKLLNLAKNGISDSAAPHIKTFFSHQGKHVQMFLQNNKFSKKCKEDLKTVANILI